jgi:heme/copper-type cytochrome/quinol oxidase subunit 2
MKKYILILKKMKRKIMGIPMITVINMIMVKVTLMVKAVTTITIILRKQKSSNSTRKIAATQSSIPFVKICLTAFPQIILIKGHLLQVPPWN